MAIRINCINKSGGNHADPHHAIARFGWVNEATGKKDTSTRAELYEWLKNQSGSAYVLDGWGNKAFAYPREHTNGTKFVQTRADNVWTDNLLALPECRS